MTDETNFDEDFPIRGQRFSSRRYPGFASGNVDAEGNVGRVPRVSNPNRLESQVEDENIGVQPIEDVATRGFDQPRPREISGIGDTLVKGGLAGLGGSIGGGIGAGQGIGEAVSGTFESVGSLVGGGSLGSSPLGFGGASFGSGIGAGAGRAIGGLIAGDSPGEIAGPAIGTAIGTTIGTAVGGPVGGFIGGFVGDTAGGFIADAAGTIICTELHRGGEISRRDWLNSHHHAQRDLTPEHVAGYQFWARHVVRRLQRGKGRRFWTMLARHRCADVAWRLGEGKFDAFGRLLNLVGEPVCYLIGCFLRKEARNAARNRISA